MQQSPSVRVGSAAWWLGRIENDDRRRRRRMLSIDKIAEAALAVLDTEGADALTMRRLAEQLQCSQASLYRHVRSRDELVAIAMDRAVRLGLRPPPDRLNWRESVTWQANSFREFLLAHPGLVPFIRGGERLSPSSLSGMESAIEQLVDAGLAVREAYTAASTLATFVLGSVQFSLDVDSMDPEEQKMRRALYAGLDPDRYPVLAEHADELSRVSGHDDFVFGLGVLLDGIELRISN